MTALGDDLAATPAEVKELLPFLTDEERREIHELMSRDTTIWRPLPGPQYMAYVSQADVVGYGGAAGGGKSDLMIGKALMKHERSLLMRREYTQMKGIVQRMTDIMGDRTGYNGQEKIWRVPHTNKIVEFGSVPNLGDEVNFQGRPRDLLGIDEAANFLQHMILFLMGWVRTTTAGQQTQTVMTFNPPTNAEGRWVVDYFAPWLDDNHLVPAAPGELRYFAMVDGEEVELPSGEPFIHGTELVVPQSRTFIPSRIADNPFLVGTGYVSTLQAMPEPLRSQMLYGDFKAGMTDDPWQVIPTAWVKAAMARWSDKPVKPPMDSMGVDVARGGKDSTDIARRHGWWFDQPLSYPGTETPDGPKVAGLTIAAQRNRAPIHIDVIGVGASPYDFLVQANAQVMGVNVAEQSNATDKSGRLTFKNLRSQLWWQFREILDPDANNGVALPPDPELEKELCAPTWKLQGSQIYVESREDIIKRIGRSPDRATAYILASINTPKHNPLDEVDHSAQRRAYDPQAGYSGHASARRKYNPYDFSGR